MTELSPEVREILVEARGLVAKGWTQRAEARNPATRRPVRPTSPLAGQWCMIGAIERSALECGDGSFFNPAKQPAVGALQRAITGQTIIGFNDSANRTQDEVLAVFDEVLAA